MCVIISKVASKPLIAKPLSKCMFFDTSLQEVVAFEADILLKELFSVNTINH